jgi:hypothetical protein
MKHTSFGMLVRRARQLDRLCYGWYLDYAFYDGKWYNVDAVKKSGRGSSSGAWALESTPREGEITSFCDRQLRMHFLHAGMRWTADGLANIMQCAHMCDLV